jgi:hypothetical protein
MFKAYGDDSIKVVKLNKNLHKEVTIHPNRNYYFTFSPGSNIVVDGHDFNETHLNTQWRNSLFFNDIVSYHRINTADGIATDFSEWLLLSYNAEIIPTSSTSLTDGTIESWNLTHLHQDYFAFGSLTTANEVYPHALPGQRLMTLKADQIGTLFVNQPGIINNPGYKIHQLNKQDGFYFTLDQTRRKEFQPFPLGQGDYAPAELSMYPSKLFHDAFYDNSYNHKMIRIRGQTQEIKIAINIQLEYALIPKPNVDKNLYSL